MNKLRTIRKHRGVKVADIAKLLKCSSVAVYYYENGTRKISIEKLKQLSKFYDCNIEELID